MGFFSAVGNAISGACSAVGNFISGVGSALGGGLSAMINGLSGVAKSIGEGIKSICESVGSEALAVIGCIAAAILIPGFGIPEILLLVKMVAEIAKNLGVNEGDDSPEELGMKAEIAEKKPEDFDSTEEYIKYLNEEVELEDGAVEKLTDEEKAKYGLLGAGMEIKAIQEKYHVDMSPEFLKDVQQMKLSGEEVDAYIKKFSEMGNERMQDMTDYLRGKPIEADKSQVSDSMTTALKEVYPELSDDEIAGKLYDMREELRED